MDNIKNDSYYIGKITENIDFIIAHTANVNIDEFSSDEVLQDSMMFRLIQISENSIKLSENLLSIGYRAFYGVDSLLVILLPKTVEMVGVNAFKGKNLHIYSKSLDI